MCPSSVDPTQDLPGCLACGTCCFSEAERYVKVSGADYERLGDDAERYVAFLGHEAFMQMAEGHCAALVIDPASGWFVCQVYERRPAICRDLERGSPHCLGELDTKASRPGQALARLRSRHGHS